MFPRSVLTFESFTGRSRCTHSRGGLVTAKDWERAGIVSAFTKSSQGRRSDLSPIGERLSFHDFSQLGTTGLEGKNTVDHYHHAWVDAMKEGAPDVQPGETVQLPTILLLKESVVFKSSKWLPRVLC